MLPTLGDCQVCHDCKFEQIEETFKNFVDQLVNCLFSESRGWFYFFLQYQGKVIQTELLLLGSLMKDMHCVIVKRAIQHQFIIIVIAIPRQIKRPRQNSPGLNHVAFNPFDAWLSARLLTINENYISIKMRPTLSNHGNLIVCHGRSLAQATGTSGGDIRAPCANLTQFARGVNWLYSAAVYSRAICQNPYGQKTKTIESALLLIFFFFKSALGFQFDSKLKEIWM